jgi:hypothetical protein
MEKSFIVKYVNSTLTIIGMSNDMNAGARTPIEYIVHVSITLQNSH